tara:strand:- start:82892 stop:83443 length:552 start_codon:yes stop_codon:yes gene_type:complete
MLFQKKRLVKNTLRYKVAMLVLNALYGRKNMYISPWQHAAVTVDGIYIYDNKLLIAKRSNNVEFAGKWQVPGGHVDMETHETLLEALKRETYEEHNLDIDTAKIDVNNPLVVRFSTQQQYIEQQDTALLGLQYIYMLSKEEMESIQISKEALLFKFADIAELERMKAAGELIHDFSYTYPYLK